MKLEDVQLAIRPRTILECLDVTFLFCGRHWLGLLLTASIGVVPFACFDWWVGDAAELNPYVAFLLGMMEIPWATMFITLYLGQTIFSQKLSIRRMLRDGLRAVPALLAFQVVIRGLCLLMGILAPVVFLGMYFLNEIILLEKTPILRIWNRRTAMNASNLGRILSVRLMELMILFGGTITLATFFRAVSSLWEDRIDSISWMLIDTEDANFNVDWQLDAAFWVVIVFLTVFRFVMYLDCRIRREGWDVELKLRSQAALYQQREAAV